MISRCFSTNSLVFDRFLLISWMPTDQSFVVRKRLDWSPKASANVQRITEPLTLWLQSWQALGSLLLMQPNMTSIFLCLTLKQLSWMLLSPMRYNISKFWVSLKLIHLYVTIYFGPCMASNNLCMSGIQSFVRLLKIWVSLPVKLITLYSLVTLINYQILWLQCPLMAQNFLLLFVYTLMMDWI